MNTLIILGLLALNFGISWLNCWSVGRIWNETRALGGWIRLVAWSAAIQSAIGFSSAFGFALGYLAYAAGHLPAAAAHGALSLWYLLIIVPALSTGLVLTIQSWIVAYRERDLLSMSTAAWNTFTQVHNMASAVGGIGDALKDVGKLFDTKDDEDGSNLVLLAVGLVVAAIGAGAVLTWVLIRRYAGTLPLPTQSLTAA